MAVHGDEALAVGVDGIVVYLSADGTVASGDTLDGDLYACCFFGGGWLAGGEGGLSYSTDLAVWQSTGPDLEGAVTGLAATEALCVGVTDRGEAFASTDGAAWTVLDYNGYYDRTASFWGWRPAAKSLGPWRGQGRQRHPDYQCVRQRLVRPGGDGGR